MSEMISNGTFHDLFSTDYLKAVWSHVSRTKLRALIASVLLVTSLVKSWSFGYPNNETRMNA